MGPFEHGNAGAVGAGAGNAEGKTAKRALAFGTLGVVFGDIGTSPLYALRESLSSVGTPTEAEIVGVVSLVIWTLVVVVTIKYVLILLMADNKGEGGTLSLMALAQTAKGGRGGIVLLLGTIGAGLFFGDALLTPAISVVSAVEGLEVAIPGIAPAVVPITAAILVALFALQGRGTGRIGAVFAPIMAAWFATLFLTGVVRLFDAPQILWAISPIEAVRFLHAHGFVGFLTLGSVFLAVTGAEALYADLGHFGRNAIRRAWLLVVFPALLITYMGQGAHAILEPHAIGSLFFSAVPGWALLPMVLLATVATVIASQAVITGAFSLTWQAMRLGLVPQLRFLHTSSHVAGRIYMPQVNWLMLAGVLAILFTFKGSSALAGAYGIAVSGTMVVTTLLAILVFVNLWGWSVVRTLAVLGPLLVMDVAFVSANLAKIESGGYVPLLVAAAIMALIWIWVRGTRILVDRLRHDSVMLADLIETLQEAPVARVDGTAVFLTATPELAPLALQHNLQHNHVLHRRNIILTVRTAPRPRVDDEARAIVATLGEDFTAVELNFGFVETPDVISGLRLARADGVDFDPEITTFFISRRSLRIAHEYGPGNWLKRPFIVMSRFSGGGSDYFAIPAGRVVEMGVQIVL